MKSAAKQFFRKLKDPYYRVVGIKDNEIREDLRKSLPELLKIQNVSDIITMNNGVMLMGVRSNQYNVSPGFIQYSWCVILTPDSLTPVKYSTAYPPLSDDHSSNMLNVRLDNIAYALVPTPRQIVHYYINSLLRFAVKEECIDDVIDRMDAREAEMKIKAQEDTPVEDTPVEDTPVEDTVIVEEETDFENDN